MATELESAISYLASDFDSIKAELIDKLRQTETWVDLYEGGIGMTLIELFSYVGDMLSFYVNMMANETYLDTAKLRSSIISLCKMIRYKLNLPSSATATVTFSQDTTHTADVTIGQYHTITRHDDELGVDIPYLTDDSLLIRIGELEGSVTVTQGTRVTGISLGTSNGTVNQDFALNVSDIAAGSITLYVDGVPWDEVDFLIDYGSDEEVYKIDWKADGGLYAYFGDNRVGKIPPDGSILTFDYTQTNEDYGNTGTNTIDVIVDPIVDDLAATVTSRFSVTNITQATGGGPKETKENAKIYAPKISRAAERAVVVEDYEGLIGHLSSIAKVNCVDRKTSDGVPFRQVWIYATPQETGPPYYLDLTPSQILEINELMQQKALAGTDWLIKTTDHVSVPIELTYYYPNPNYVNTVELQINNALIDYFAIDNEDREYGETIVRNDLIVTLTNLSQVALIELTSPAADIILTYNQYPILGSVTLNVGGLI